MLSTGDNNSPVSPDDRLQGTLDLLILRTLADEPLHGWAISRRIRERSGDVLQVNQGSLYPALHRLENEGWLAAEWTVAETGRRAKVYRLTAQGRRASEREERGWLAFVAAVTHVLQPAV
jgi:PadR family transcriptional regulator, regulatory protein PadR